eukprot:gene6753-9254_t
MSSLALEKQFLDAINYMVDGSDLNLANLQKIINSKPDLLTYQEDKYGYNILHFSIIYDNISVFSWLMSFNSDLIHHATKKGYNFIHIAVLNDSWSILHYIKDVINIQSNIADNYSNSSPITTKSMWYALLNQQDLLNQSCLHIACATGKKDMVSLLLSIEGINQSLKDHWNRTAYDIAKQYNYDILLDCLNRNYESADDSEYNLKGTLDNDVANNTDYYKSTQKSVTEELINALKIKSNIAKKFQNNNLIKVRTMFEDKYERIDGTICDMTTKPTPDYDYVKPSILASSSSTNATLAKKSLSKFIEYPGDKLSIIEMIESPDEYDVNGKDMFGWTALHKFACWNKVELLKLLTSIACVDMNVKGSKDQFTCIHCCVDMESINALEYLLADNRIDLTIADKQNRTAYDFAKEKNNPFIIQLLESKINNLIIL